MYVVYFSKTTGETGFLSNFFKSKFTVSEEQWDTVEHFFQAMKFRGSVATERMVEYSNIIKNSHAPGKAKALGTQRHNKFNWLISDEYINDIIDNYIDVKIRSDWEEVKLSVMAHAVYNKFTSNDKLLKKLLEFGDDVLFVEKSRKDSFWGDGGNGSGKNYFGRLITILRYCLKYGEKDEETDLSMMHQDVRLVCGEDLLHQMIYLGIN